MATRGIGAPTVLTNSSVAIVTSGAAEYIAVVRANVQNNDTTARVITVHQVPSGGSVSDNTKVHTQTVYAGQSTSLDTAGMIANNGGALYFKADVTNVVVLSLNYFRSDQQP